MYFHSPAAGGEGCRSEATESLRVRDVLPFPRRRRGGMPERSDGIPESEGLLVLLFEGEGGGAVEAVQAYILARKTYALDKSLYRIEFQ